MQGHGAGPRLGGKLGRAGLDGVVDHVEPKPEPKPREGCDHQGWRQRKTNQRQGGGGAANADHAGLAEAGQQGGDQSGKDQPTKAKGANGEAGFHGAANAAFDQQGRDEGKGAKDQATFHRHRGEQGQRGRIGDDAAVALQRHYRIIAGHCLSCGTAGGQDQGDKAQKGRDGANHQHAAPAGNGGDGPCHHAARNLSANAKDQNARQRHLPVF